MKKIFILFFVLIVSDLVFAQTDWKKWEGRKISYAVSSSVEEGKTIKTKIDFTVISQKLYKNLFSDYDGDNCAFYPSCSSFFVQAVHKTNFIKGALLFVDRFTRDLNYAKGYDNYPFYKDGHFFDPVEKYTR